MIRSFYIILFLTVIKFSLAQTVVGKLDAYADKKLSLFGFQGLKSVFLDSVMTGKDGYFSLNYDSNYLGAGILKDEYNNIMVLTLTEKLVELSGPALDERDKIRIVKGEQNKKLQEYFVSYPNIIREIGALKFLQFSYQNINEKRDESFLKDIKIQIDKKVKHFDQKKSKELNFLESYIDIHFFMAQVLSVPSFSLEKRNQILKDYRAIDLANKNLYSSGLIGEILSNHFLFIESSFEKLDEVYFNLQQSINVILEDTQENELLYNDVVQYLFNLLESKSLFVASEYLALKVLNNNSCHVNDVVTNQLEMYRKLKIGAIAPDIEFGAAIYFSKLHIPTPSRLSEIASDYTLIIFAAGWCSHCVEEVPKAVPLYEKWKAKGVEVLLISLDDSPISFAEFAAPLPFISTTDYKIWDGQAVKDYHIYGTPTMFLVNNKREILQKINSVKHMDAWVDWYLK
jgi:thiol-disulfide isomerase/thioredoxin